MNNPGLRCRKIDENPDFIGGKFEMPDLIGGNMARSPAEIHSSGKSVQRKFGAAEIRSFTVGVDNICLEVRILLLFIVILIFSILFLTEKGRSCLLSYIRPANISREKYKENRPMKTKLHEWEGNGEMPLREVFIYTRWLID